MGVLCLFFATQLSINYVTKKGINVKQQPCFSQLNLKKKQKLYEFKLFHRRTSII